MSTSRWLTWTPKGALLATKAHLEPPKPSKITSGGFEGTTPELFPIVEYSNAEMNAVTAEIFRWIRARCVKRGDTWSSEKSLWRDYHDWRQQHRLSVARRERFVEILDRLFRRELDGWRGIALAIDVVASTYIM